MKKEEASSFTTKKAGLQVKAKKTQYIFMSHKQNVGQITTYRINYMNMWKISNTLKLH